MTLKVGLHPGSGGGGGKLRVLDQRSVAVPKVDRRTFLPGRQLEGQKRKVWDCGLDSFPLRQRVQRSSIYPRQMSSEFKK